MVGIVVSILQQGGNANAGVVFCAMVIARTRCDAVKTVATLVVLTFIVLLAALIGDAALIATAVTMGLQTKLIQATVGRFADLVGIGATGDRLATLPAITVLLKGAIFEDLAAAPDTETSVQLHIVI